MNTKDTTGTPLRFPVILTGVTVVAAVVKLTVWPELSWLAVLAPALIINGLLILSILIQANVRSAIRMTIRENDVQNDLRRVIGAEVEDRLRQSEGWGGGN